MLQGDWILVSGEQDGATIPEADLDKYSLSIVDNQHRVSWTNAALQGTHELDTSQSPMTINSVDSAGPFEGMKLEGIFELNDDEFTVCFAGPGQSRPTEFTTANGHALILHKWKKKASN